MSWGTLLAKPIYKRSSVGMIRLPQRLVTGQMVDLFYDSALAGTGAVLTRADRSLAAPPAPSSISAA